MLRLFACNDFIEPALTFYNVIYYDIKKGLNTGKPLVSRTGGRAGERERENSYCCSTTFLWTTISFYSWKITVWIHYATVLLIFFITCPRHYQVPWHTMSLSLSHSLSLSLRISPLLSLSLYVPLCTLSPAHSLSLSLILYFPLSLSTLHLSLSPPSLSSPSRCLSLTPSVALASLRYNVIGDAWMQ